MILTKGDIFDTPSTNAFSSSIGIMIRYQVRLGVGSRGWLGWRGGVGRGGERARLMPAVELTLAELVMRAQFSSGRNMCTEPSSHAKAFIPSNTLCP